MNWTFEYNGSLIETSYVPVVGFLLDAVTLLAITDPYYGPCPAGTYLITRLSGNRVSIESSHSEDAHLLTLQAAVDVSFAVGNANKNILPGYSISLSPLAAEGTSARIIVGGVDGRKFLSLGMLLSTVGAQSGRELSVTNASGVELSGCYLVATNGVFIQNDNNESPFQYWYQGGLQNPDADEAPGGAEITFEAIGSLQPEVIFSLAMTANDAPEPSIIEVSDEATEHAGWNALDDDEDTSWTSDTAVTTPTPAYWAIDLGSGNEELFNKLVVTCGADPDTYPTHLIISGYYNGQWNELAEVTNPTIADGEFTVTWVETEAAQKYKVDILATANDAVVDIVQFLFSFVDTSIRYSLLIDAVEQEVIDTSTDLRIGVGEGLVLGTEYRFPSDSKYRSVVFSLSEALSETDTATIWVSDGGEMVELSSDGVSYSHAGSGILITSDGQDPGVMGSVQIFAWWMRLRCEQFKESDLNQRWFSLRAVGYEAAGDERCTAHVGTFEIIDVAQTVLTAQLSVIQNEFPRPRYTYVPDPDPEIPGTYVVDANGLYVETYTAPGSYTLIAEDPLNGNYPSVTDVLAANGITLI